MRVPAGVLMIVAAVLIAVFMLNGGPSFSQAPREPHALLADSATQAARSAPPTATAFVIEYVVSSDASESEQRVDIEWRSGDSPSETETNYDIGAGVWSRFVTVKPGSDLSLTASNGVAGDDRRVRCAIYLSGRLWDSDEAAGGASCSAVAGW